VTRLLLIRHGETDWNIEGRWQGQADVPLNAKGRQQAADLASALSTAQIASVYSSDLSRAAETAGILARVIHADVTLDRRLREIHQGEWQGRLATDIQRLYAMEFGRRKADPQSVAPPGGETAADVMLRALASIHDIARAHPGGTVAVVSHGFLIATLLSHFRNLPIEKVWDLVPQNGSWNEVLTTSSP
jgi:broad specificity phosphatase PhoE